MSYYCTIRKLLVFIVLFSFYVRGQSEICAVNVVFSAKEHNIAGEIAYVSIAPTDADLISFESFERGIFHYLWWMDVEKGELNQITPIIMDGGYRGPHADRDIDWSPVQYYNKNWFVFVSTGDDGNDNLYIGNTSEDMYIQLTKSRHTDHRPRWSPDGRSIVYVSAKTGNGDLYLIDNIDGILRQYERWYSGVIEQIRRGFTYTNKIYDLSENEVQHIRLTSSPVLDSNPNWSPDGRYIVYQSLVTDADVGTIGLYLIDMKKKGQKPTNILTPRTYDAIYPRWAYDQRHIAYFLAPIARDDTDAIHQLAYLMIQLDDGRVVSHSQVEIVDRNVRGTRLGPSWGTGSRSIIYVQHDGMASRIVGRQSHASNPRLAELRENKDGIVYREVQTAISLPHKRIVFITYEDQDYKIYKGRFLGGIFEHRESDVYITIPQTERKITNLNVGMHLLELQSLSGDKRDNSDNSIVFGQSTSIEFDFFLGHLLFLPLNFSLGITAANILVDIENSTYLLELYGAYNYNILPRMYIKGFGGIGKIFTDNDNNDDKDILTFGLQAGYKVTDSLIIAPSAVLRTFKNPDNGNIFDNSLFGFRFGLFFRIF